MTESDQGFVASKGHLKITGEKPSSNESAIEPFRIELLLRVINEKNLSSEQIYNADESGLFWQMLPDKTLADLNEKVAPGRKVIKARTTFMQCANVAGKHKLPLFVVGTAKKNPSLTQSCSLYLYSSTTYEIRQSTPKSFIVVG
ncbi:hypothetical protein J437_LFUL013619 [Ladona fulva]|uniref:DDE-1 domain-containing protein n=1 Tax=Ladona fulva TaxID=123851 RepID=A0A8K0KPR6_LADFU|nr:hypothetical protein J437_LFUL013619 [Ladona fulva]